MWAISRRQRANIYCKTIKKAPTPRAPPVTRVTRGPTCSFPMVTACNGSGRIEPPATPASYSACGPSLGPPLLLLPPPLAVVAAVALLLLALAPALLLKAAAGGHRAAQPPAPAPPAPPPPGRAAPRCRGRPAGVTRACERNVLRCACLVRCAACQGPAMRCVSSNRHAQVQRVQHARARSRCGSAGPWPHLSAPYALWRRSFSIADRLEACLRRAGQHSRLLLPAWPRSQEPSDDDVSAAMYFPFL